MNKKTALTGLALVAGLLASLPSYGEENKEEWALAINILKGKDTIRTKEWAVQRLEQAQEAEPNAFVKNVLGIAYLHGIGTEADTARAVMNFEQSGSMGYTMAYHNLGMFYKYADGGKQDFVKAYAAFQKGADKGHPNCLYDFGYMQYKGLGCVQDYEGAVGSFRRSAERNHPGSLYMLGLCYRNGYGVEADTAIGNFYLRQSAALGLPDATEELLNETPEAGFQRDYAVLVEGLETPEEMPSIVPYLPVNNRVLAGKYVGLMVTYDWSGTNVIAEKPLSVDMNVVRDSASGTWIQGNDTIPFAAAITDEGIIRFNRTSADLYDRYAYDYHAHFRFEQADMNYRNGFITGQLRLYSLDEMEPERPMYISLVKESLLKDGEIETEDPYRTLYAYSDPKSDRVVLKFELAEAVPSVHISFYTRTGINIQNFSYGGLSAGKHTLNVYPTLEDGFYTIRVVAGDQKLQTIIVK